MSYANGGPPPVKAKIEDCLYWVDNTARIDRDAKIGRGTWIGAHVSIAHGVTIGEDCVIQAGVRIGEDGFGYSRTPDGRHVHRKHFGGVVIEDDVHIGANSVIHQGTHAPTRIRRGARIDGLTFIAHNCDVGEDAVICAGCVLCGSVKLGPRAYVAPGAAIRDHRTIEADAMVGMSAAVIRDVRRRETVAGVPAKVLE